jgi:putative oxidoreductase
MKKLCQLSFCPRSTDFGLLLLRLWFGLTLFFNHGLGKLENFAQMKNRFPDPLHIGSEASLILVMIAEVLCAALITVGFATRLAALIIAISFTIAFFGVHHHVLAMVPGSGELPFLYLGAALTIMFAGGGRFVVCRQSNIVEVTPVPAA